MSSYDLTSAPSKRYNVAYVALDMNSDQIGIGTGVMRCYSSNRPAIGLGMYKDYWRSWVRLYQANRRRESAIPSTIRAHLTVSLSG